ncbi:MAG: cellobiose phosphorylase, partial [bacterium]|nr:cellobiose phosphorylase [bacterium]
MENKLYKFTDERGSFVSTAADKVKALYLPLANERLMSSVSPDLHGDIKAGHGAFLMPPVSRLDLSDSRFSRNFWIYTSGGKVWSAAGASKDLKQIKADKFKLAAGLLWQKITRENRSFGLQSEILSFVPASGEPVEIMQVTLTNISRRNITISPTCAIPIYGRGADNLRDHRHVTSLLHRITLNKFGVIVKPTLSFNEAGHQPNKTLYFVLGWDQNSTSPQYIYPTHEIFCGDAGDLEAPESVLENSAPCKIPIQGKEAFGGLRFREITLAPGASRTYIIVMGITENEGEISAARIKFNTVTKVAKALAQTKEFWSDLGCRSGLKSGESDFDQWFSWVSIQPVLRRIFGCSFLPDFDYGRGGRGWRDLWQDCLGLILTNPKDSRALLVNNFAGVRIDGSNATIIGIKPGDFISDRNNISR